MQFLISIRRNFLNGSQASSFPYPCNFLPHFLFHPKVIFVTMSIIVFNAVSPLKQPVTSSCPVCARRCQDPSGARGACELPAPSRRLKPLLFLAVERGIKIPPITKLGISLYGRLPVKKSVRDS